MAARFLIFAWAALAAWPAAVAQPDSIERFPGMWIRILPPGFLENTPDVRLLDAESDSAFAVAALWRLFPGSDLPSVREDREGEDMVAWACPDCPLRTFPSGWGWAADSTEDVIAFPYEANFTAVLGTLRFRDQAGTEFILVSFNTAEDWLPSGRFTHGILGLALFERQDRECLLRSFAPALDASGGFMRAFPPDTAWNAASKQPLFVINAFEPPGFAVLRYWPMYSQLRIYSVIAGKFERILLENDTECRNVWLDAPGPHWVADFSLEPASGDFPDLTITRRGRFEKNDEWEKEGAEMFVLPGLEPYAASGKPFNFVIKTRFVFDGKTYQAAPRDRVEVKY